MSGWARRCVSRLALRGQCRYKQSPALKAPVAIDDSKSKRRLRKEEQTEYFKKLINIDPVLNKSEKQLAELADGAFKKIMRLGKGNKLEEALQCYDETKHLQSPSRHYFTISFLIGACQTADHLPSAIRLFNEMSTNNFIPNEAAYLSLIRCFCSAGNVKAAIEIIGKMFALGVDIKLRCCHPVVEELCRSGRVADLRHAFSFVDYVIDKSVKIQVEQIIVMAEGIFKGKGRADPELVKKLEALIELCSEYTFGMPREDLDRMASKLLPAGPSSAAGFGRVLTDADYQEESGARAQFSGQNSEAGEAGAGGRDDALLLSPDELASRKPAVAALVNVSHRTARCPNCGGTLTQQILSLEEQQKVRTALYGLAEGVNARQVKQLKKFSNWLSSKPEFDYIIDAANIAYSRQNHDNGKFSFRQIETVVDHLLVTCPEKRALVLIPSCYLSNSMPNNVKKNVLSYVQKTRDDQRIVDRLKKMDMLYEVPKGADDDWYWIFATVNEGRSRHANVITNDLMRDHKLAFMEPRPFLRWRNAHVSLYDLVDNSPRVQIRDPATFGREIQFNDNGRVHIPSVEDDSWLCANFKEHISETK